MIQKLITLLNSAGLTAAYDHFAEGESYSLPCAIFRLVGDDNFGADNKVYKPIREADIELYTEKKNPVTEALITDVLDSNNIFYTVNETWIQSERMYQVVYSFEIHD